VAGSLWNLAALYKGQERFAEAEPLYLEAIRIFYQRLGEQHAHTQSVGQSFVSCLQKAIESDRTSELSDHPMTRSLLQALQSPSA
jgi:hypothetical protein